MDEKKRECTEFCVNSKYIVKLIQNRPKNMV